jgi:hypothetical protein
LVVAIVGVIVAAVDEIEAAAFVVVESIFQNYEWLELAEFLQSIVMIFGWLLELVDCKRFFKGLVINS